MNLYQEKLKEYQEKLQKYEEAEKALKTSEEILKRKREELFQYVEENIVSKDYTIGHKQMPEGYELYYPILNLPEGFELRKEQFSCDTIYKEGEVFSVIRHEYVLVNRKDNLSIYVSEEATKRNIEYFNKNIHLEIKDATLVMDNFISYKIVIGNMDFKFQRDFKGDIILDRLTSMLKNKYISLNDFGRTSPKGRRKRIYKYTKRCMNHFLYSESDWKKNVVDYLEEIVGECESENIVSDIEGKLPQITSLEYIEKIYQLNKGNSLISELYKKHWENECIAYEDEQLILEIPLPIRYVLLNLCIVSKDYQEDLEKYISNDDIKDKNFFYIRMNNDLNMSKKMSVLDILQKYKD